MHAHYRKMNDGSHNSSKYHKLDGTAVRAKLKAELTREEQNRDWEADADRAQYEASL
jgi:hypothetical protein